MRRIPSRPDDTRGAHPSSGPRASFLALALAAAIGSLSPASELDATTLATTAEAGLEDGKLVVRIAIRNDGPSTARSLETTLRFLDQEVSADVEPVLEPGRTFSSSLSIAPESITPGRWPYRIETAYLDALERPAHGLHVGHFVVGSTPSDAFRLEVPASLELSDRTVLAVRLVNTGPARQSISLTAHAPASLGTSTPTVLELEAGDTASANLPLANVSAPAGSRLPVFVVASYSSGGIEHTLIEAVPVDIVEAPTSAPARSIGWWLAAGALWLLWAAIAALRHRVRRRRSAAGNDEPRGSTARRRLVQDLIDGVAVVAATAFVGSYFPASLLFAETTTNGGDMASHVFTATYLTEVLLPRGELLGWCPGNLAGFPFLQFYFPLPFLAMAALSTTMPLLVAFKLVTISGALLLPLTCWAALRLLGSPFPGPAMGSVASLCFVFMEDNSMWGGNLPSLLAGEFSFSLGFALAVLFVGTLGWSARTGRGATLNGLLEAVVGLCHGYALLWAGLMSLLELVTIERWWQRFGLLVRVHGLAILLMAFWLVPLLVYSPWTTAYSSVWLIESWQEIVPPILWPAAIVAVASTAVLLLVERRLASFPRVLGTLWGAILLSLFFYKTAPSFHVVDIRFMPFLQLAICLLAAAGLAELAARLPGREIWPLATLAIVLPFVHSSVSYIPGWIEWNYSGFERKPSWPVLRDISDYVAGDFGQPRVAWEHSPAHESLGTVRAFENLPLFSGRATLEGVYMQAAATAPFVFYIQSEISKVTSCPFPKWGCATLDLERGAEHLRMFNASQLIVRSPEAKRAASEQPGLRRQAAIGEYEIHEVLDGDSGYAEALAVAPYIVRDRQWKEAAYRWFKYAGSTDPVPVFASDVEEDTLEPFADVYEQLPARPRVRALADPPPLEVEVALDRIVVTGARPGHPVLVRVTYHPRWRSVTGERIWLAGPSFMLVVPKGPRVELEFSTGPVLSTGRVLSILGIVLVVAAMIPAARRRAARLAAALPRVAAVERLAGRPERWRRRLLAAGVGLAVITLTVLAVALHRPDADTLYRRAQARFRAEELAAAAELYRQAYTRAPLSMTAIHSRYFEAISYFKMERWREAEDRFRALIEEFPEAPNVAEDLWHIGLCRQRLGDEDGARSVWDDLVARFSETQWAEYARQRLGRGGATGDAAPPRLER